MADATQAVTQQEPWVNELMYKLRGLEMRKQFLQKAVLKGDLEDVKARIEDMKTVLREVEACDIEILPQSEAITRPRSPT